MLVYFFRHLPRVFLIIDYIILNLCLILGELYYFGSGAALYSSDDYKARFLMLNFSWLIISRLTGLYKSLTFKESSLQFNALTKALLLLVVFFFIYLGSVSLSVAGYADYGVYFLAVGFLMFLMRFLFFLYRKGNRVKIGRKIYSFNTVLIGNNKFSKSLMSNNDLRQSMGIRGIYSIKENGSETQYIGGTDKLFEDLEEVKINNIIFCDDEIELELYNRIVDIAEQKMIRVYMVPDFKYVSMEPYHFDKINEVPFLKLIREPLANPKKQVLKRTFDIVFSLFVIVFLLSWLIPIVALIIKLESKGAVFFKQKRSGLNNEPFECIKFRSMTVNKSSDLITTTKNDSRVTKFGAFIRKTSIDELPQFINVFLGDMSVVGPRPHMLSQTELYSKITKKYMTRHIVKPGITGWAQVMGSRGEIFSDKDMEKRIEKDIWYIQNWSFFLDIKIIFLTLYNIVKGDEQAY